MACSPRNRDKPSMDLQKLRISLISLEKELATPYVKRRNLFDGNDQLQLKDSLSEISKRENDLIAAIGISKFLIESNEKSSERIKELEENNSWITLKNEELEIELSKIKDELFITEDKYHEIERSLEKTEDELAKVLSEKNKILSNNSSSSISIQRFNQEIGDIKARFREEYDFILSIYHIGNKINAEKKNFELEEKVLALKSQVSHLESEVKILTQEKLHEIELTKTISMPLPASPRLDSDDLYERLENTKFSPESESTQMNVSQNSILIVTKNCSISPQESFSLIGKKLKSSSEEEYFKIVKLK